MKFFAVLGKQKEVNMDISVFIPYENDSLIIKKAQN